MSDTPTASAFKAVMGAVLRHLITAAGTALVAHGYLDQQTADGAVSPIADYVIGAAFALGSAGWAAFRARASHWRWVKALYAPALPNPDSDPVPVAPKE